MSILIMSMSLFIKIYNAIMFDKRLKELRKEHDYTQKELAQLIGCDQSMITRWEKGECEPTESVIRKTARIFGVTSDYLIGLENEDGSKVEW